MGDRARRDRANTVSMIPPPMTPMPLPASVPRTSKVTPTLQASPAISPPLAPNPLKTRPSIDLNLEDETELKTSTSPSPSISDIKINRNRNGNVNGNVNGNGNNTKNKIKKKKKKKKKTGKYSVVINNIDEEEENKTGRHIIQISGEDQSIDLRFPVPDLQNFGGHINRQATDLTLSDQELEMKLLISEIGQNSNGPTMNLSTPRMDFDDGKSYVHIFYVL